MDLFENAVMKVPGGFRLLHSADWHLGKMLGDFSREEEHRLFLDWLLGEIRAREADALVVAGDVFDSAYPPQSALRLYYSFLSEVYRTTSCTVVVVAGNHDSPAQLEAPKYVLEAVRARVVGAFPEDPNDALVVLEDGQKRPRLVVAAVPFLRDRDLRRGEEAQSEKDIRRALVGGIARRYEEMAEAAGAWVKKGIPAMATGHLTVANSKRSESEREIHIGGLGSVNADIFPKSFGYVALGHLHRPQAADAAGVVRYSGSPIPLSFGEAMDKKEVRVVDFGSDGKVSSEAVLVPVWRKLVQVCCGRGELGLRMEELGKRMGGSRNADWGVRNGGGESRGAEGELRKGGEVGAGDGKGGRVGGRLRSWVEVVVKDPIAGENVFEMVREMAAGMDFEVVRVVAKATAKGITGEQLEGGGGADGGDILNDPETVFGMRLEGEAGLGENEREELGLAFRELMELHGQKRREEEVAG